MAEDSGASAIGVLANDDNDDGGPISAESVTQPVNGAVVITGGGARLTYEPDADYCNDPLGRRRTRSRRRSTAARPRPRSVTVTCAPDNPVVDTSAGSTRG